MERFVNSYIAECGEYWWNPQRPDQPSLWDSKIELSEKFFNEIINHPVPISSVKTLIEKGFHVVADMGSGVRYCDTLFWHEAVFKATGRPSGATERNPGVILRGMWLQDEPSCFAVGQGVRRES